MGIYDSGYEYLWESGEFVLFKRAPESRFPFVYEVINKRTRDSVFGTALNYSEDGIALLTRLRDEGVPEVDDVSNLGVEFRKPLEDWIEGKITRQELEEKHDQLRRRSTEISAEIRAAHFARHPEQRPQKS